MSTVKPFRRKGMLAFLEDSATLFPYDADACKKTVALPPRRQRRGRRKDRNNILPEEEETSPLTAAVTTLTEIMTNEQPRVVLLFFYDPEQTYSIKVRNRILQVVSWSKQQQKSYHRDDTESSSSGILCCAVTLGKDDTQPLSPSDHDFLASTGMLATRVASAMALHNIFLPRVQGLPHLMLVSAENGQVFGGSHEEIALEWNRPEFVHGRWMDEVSGLDCCQQVLSGIMFPTACAIL